ncbi:MAG: YggS family pyridoxal phosphate-dependent enzyme [Archangium sp.]|nr:YggS family pyridoxal phosphate-dependent enzyme [Archangium sp.]
MIDKPTLQANFAALEARLVAACAKANRPRAAVSLIAVSKLHPPELIRFAWELGHRDFGENYAQELRDKHAGLADCAGLRWHAIGPVQPKNAKYVAKAATVFHALERLDVAQELSKRRVGTPLQCLIEVNVGAEESKAGLPPSDVASFVTAVRALPQLELVGLTAMPPQYEDPELARPHFKLLRELAAEHGLAQLSMGTTSDFAVAIEEGATMVRVGTALFGHRPP